MKSIKYFQSGPFVAYAHDPNTHTTLRVCARPGAAAIAESDYSLLPLCTSCTQAHFDSIKSAALNALGLCDQEAMYADMIATYEAEQEAKHQLFA